MPGRLVFFFSALFAHRLTYTGVFTPAIDGPDLDATFLLACRRSAGWSSLIVYLAGMAGWIVFSVAFRAYLSLTYRKLLASPK